MYSRERRIQGEIRKHILLVDDEAGFRLSASVALRKAGYTVSVAGSGGEAIAMIATMHDRGEQIDLLLTDIRMPSMSGIDLVDQMRARGIRTPFFAISCFSDRALVRELAVRGCRGFIEKPFQPSDLIGRIRELLEEDPGGVA